MLPPLSECIRLGAMLAPKNDWSHSEPGRLCALEAACVAIGVDRKEWADVCILWGWTWDTLTTCPVCDRNERVVDLIWHLNDRHCWTRERIAAWVASKERELTEVPCHAIMSE